MRKIVMFLFFALVVVGLYTLSKEVTPVTERVERAIDASKNL